jgi:2-hydroxy-3-keto-5-methylthiopentenyl-1-phosphate phosphatase
MDYKKPGGAMEKRIAVFCDFDGTITEKDMIIAIMEKFGAPGWEQIGDRIMNREISIRRGVGQMFAGIPSERREAMTDYALEEAVVRPGFREFLEYCEMEGIVLRVTSGGIDFFVLPILEPFFDDPESIYCNGSDFSGPYVQVVWNHPCDKECGNDCGLCKPSILRQYPRDTFWRIVVGDSITDLEAAKMADLVVARSLLLRKCEELGLPHRPFETFYDVVDAIQEWRETR